MQRPRALQKRRFRRYFVPLADADRLQLYGRELSARRAGPHEVLAGIEPDHFLDRILGHDVVVAGSGHFREEFGGRDLFRLDARLVGDFCLGHSQRRIDERTRIDLHPHRVGVGRVDPVETEYFLQKSKYIRSTVQRSIRSKVQYKQKACQAALLGNCPEW